MQQGKLVTTVLLNKELYQAPQMCLLSKPDKMAMVVTRCID